MTFHSSWRDQRIDDNTRNKHYFPPARYSLMCVCVCLQSSSLAAWCDILQRRLDLQEGLPPLSPYTSSPADTARSHKTTARLDRRKNWNRFLQCLMEYSEYHTMQTHGRSIASLQSLKPTECHPHHHHHNHICEIKTPRTERNKAITCDLSTPNEPIWLETSSLDFVEPGGRANACNTVNLLSHSFNRCINLSDYGSFQFQIRIFVSRSDMLQYIVCFSFVWSIFLRSSEAINLIWPSLMVFSHVSFKKTKNRHTISFIHTHNTTHTCTYRHELPRFCSYHSILYKKLKL